MLRSPAWASASCRSNPARGRSGREGVKSPSSHRCTSSSTPSTVRCRLGIGEGHGGPQLFRVVEVLRVTAGDLEVFDRARQERGRAVERYLAHSKIARLRPRAVEMMLLDDQVDLHLTRLQVAQALHHVARHGGDHIQVVGVGLAAYAIVDDGRAVAVDFRGARADHPGRIQRDRNRHAGAVPAACTQRLQPVLRCFQLQPRAVFPLDQGKYAGQQRSLALARQVLKSDQADSGRQAKFAARHPVERGVTDGRLCGHVHSGQAARRCAIMSAASGQSCHTGVQMAGSSGKRPISM